MSNKSTIGLSHAKYAKRTVTGNSVTIHSGRTVPGAVEATIEVEYEETEKYADDELIFSDKTFKKGSVSFTGAVFDDADYAYLIGADLVPLGDGNYEIKSPIEDNSPEVCFGMVAPGINRKNGAYKKGYTAVYLPFTKFSEQGTSAKTKGNNTQFSDPKLVGTIASQNGYWKEMATFDTMEEADNYLNQKMHLDELVEAPVASVHGGQYTSTQSVALTCATPGATIKYSLNGGAEQTYSAAVSVSATTVLRAYAVKSGMEDSPRITEIYEIHA